MSQFREGVKTRRVHHARRYIFGAAAAGALGFALMLAANDGIFFPKYQYKYVSKGVIQAGEGENIFGQYRNIQSMRMMAKVISTEEMSRLVAEFESNRVRHQTVESWRDRGSVYFENVAGGRRMFELADKRYVQSEQNKILQYLGGLLAFCGALALVDANGKINSGLSLTFDRFRQDQAIQLLNNDSATHQETYIKINDVPSYAVASMEDERRFGEEARKLDGLERQAYWGKLAEDGRRSVNRIWIGNTGDKGSTLQLKDAQGRARMKLLVSAAGKAEIQMLDETGKVVRSITPDLQQ